MIKKIVAVLDGINLVLFVSLSLLSFMGVFFRYVLNNSLTWAEEVTRYMFIWMTFLGCALCVRRRKHIVMDIVVSMLKGRPKKILSILNNLILFAFVVVLVREGVRMMPIMSMQTSTANGIPMSLIYGAVPVGAALMGFYLVLDCWLLWKDQLPAEMSDDQQAEISPDAI